MLIIMYKDLISNKLFSKRQVIPSINDVEVIYYLYVHVKLSLPLSQTFFRSVFESFFLSHSLTFSLPFLAVRVFASGPGDLGSIQGRVIPKTQKMVLDASLLNTQYYKVRIKGKVEQSRERSRALPYTLV